MSDILPTEPDPAALITLVIGEATAQLRAEHRQETTGLQKAVDRVTAIVGWPGFVAVIAVAIGPASTRLARARRLGATLAAT